MRNCYRVCAQISLDALEHNVKEIRRKIGQDTKLMCVVKTNAYGHGAVVLAQELEKMGADAFAVATVEEGLELRRHDVVKPILVLGYVAKEQYREMIENDIMPAVYTYNMAKELDGVAAGMNRVAKIHIKIDTGMSRIGFKPDMQSVRDIMMISQLRKNLELDGIFTHFCCADCEDEEMTRLQAQRFTYVIDELEKQGVYIPVKHCANSAAIARFPEMKMTMCRAGIILYGLYPSEVIDKSMIDLKPLMKIKSHVVHVKTVEAGTSVGYGATYVCQNPTKIATISIGYGDGYPRAMSNRGRVLIGEQSFPIIGRVCMDQLMVDITDAKFEIRQGDEVVMIGSQGSECIPVEEVADASMSFNYEFVCDINRRVPRVYTRNGKVQTIVNYMRY